MALRDLIKKVMSTHHLNAEFFAEEVTYIPVSNGESRQVTVHITDGSDLQIEGSSSIIEEDEILVLAFRDTNAADGERAIGGIDSYDIGDKITRAGDVVPYYFSREIKSKTPEKVRLVFSRALQVSHGKTF